jgi:hypothetical protein
MPPTLAEALQETRALEAASLTAFQIAPRLTEGLPDTSMLTGGLPDAPTLTLGLPETPTLTEGLPDAPTLTGGLPETPMLTGGSPETPTLTEGLPETPMLTGGLPEPPKLTGGLPDVSTLADDLQGAPAPTGERPTIRLTDEIREFVVRSLARYETPSQVAAAVREVFGIEVSRQLIYKYDPAGSKPPAQRWIDLHAATRARFLAELAEIGVAQKVVRLQMLDRFAREADDNDDFSEAAAFLEQAAKECGGIYERRKRRSG